MTYQMRITRDVDGDFVEQKLDVDEIELHRQLRTEFSQPGRLVCMTVTQAES